MDPPIAPSRQEEVETVIHLYESRESVNKDNSACSSRFKFLREKRNLEFLLNIGLGLLSIGMLLYPVAHREIPSLSVTLNGATLYSLDPAYNYKMKPQSVPMIPLLFLSYALPLVIQVFLSIKQSAISYFANKDNHDYILSLSFSATISHLITSFLKVSAGRLRPCFFDMCKWNHTALWDGSSNLCTSYMELEARKSFPSGHTSAAFAGLFHATLYLLYKIHKRKSGVVTLGLWYLALFPTVLASWIGITRTLNNYHHFSDVVAGAGVGIFSAIVAFLYVYRNRVFEERNRNLIDNPTDPIAF